MNALKLIFEQIHPLWIIAKFTLWGGTPSTPDTTTQITELPEWARGYAKDTLSKASALTDINSNPYQQYGGERIAGFTDLQNQAQQGAANMGVSGQVGMGSGLAGAAGLGALGANYQGGNFQGGQFNSQAAQQYMSPYNQNVVDYQKSQALRDYQIAQPMRNAQAVQQGAFGGSRSAIVDAEAQRNLNSQLQGIEATGQQNAYANAQQQFNTDQSRGLQAQQLGEQSRQYGAGLGMQGLQTALQSANTLGTLGQTQYGQQMGINQLQNAYGTQQQQQAQRPLDQAYQDFMNQQNYPYKQLGFMSDMIRGLPLGQQSTAQVYQAPPSAIQTVGALGLGAYGANQLFGSPSAAKAEGGLAEAYAGGGMVAFGNGGDTDISHSPMDDPSKMAEEVANLSDEQLQQIVQHPSSAAELQAAKMELATRASEHKGLASAYNMMPQQAPTTQATPQAPMMQAAKGGIMYFEKGGETDDDEEEDQLAAFKEEQLAALDPGGTGDADARKLWNDRLGKAYTNLETTTSTPMTDNQRRANTLANYKEVQDMAGPDPSKAQIDRIAGLEKQQAANLEQQKGLAALAAIPEILKGGDAARGLGAGAGAFGGMYGKAIQADRAEKLSLMSMKNNLEQAQYKTKVGMVGDARQLTAEARKDKQAADAANTAKQKAMGVLAAQAVKINAPIKPAAVKFEPADSRALTNLINEAYGNTPQKKGESDEAYKRRVEGIGTRNYAREMKQEKDITSRSTVDSTVTSKGEQTHEIKPEGAEAQIRTDANAIQLADKRRQALKDAKNSTPYLAAQRRNDTTTMKKIEEDAVADFPVIANPKPSQQQSNNNPASNAAPVNAPPISMLKPGEITTFKNGQKWKINAKGQPEQVK